MNRISFMLANYVARQVGYNMDRGWGQGSKATIAYFTPADTFASRFDEYLRDVRALGFDAIDMWTDILGPPFATPEHAAHICEILDATTESARLNRPVEITSSFTPPAPMEWAL